MAIGLTPISMHKLFHTIPASSNLLHKFNMYLHITVLPDCIRPSSIKASTTVDLTALVRIMGVPSFFRWLARKYPKLLVNVVVDGIEIPINTADPNPNGVEYDCLYLDMNGIIHPCAHPENKDQPANEEEIMIAIGKYIDRLFSIVRPRRLLYMAIDGVAPRAKMNQQRSRRFRAVREAKMKAKVEAEVHQDLISRGLIVESDIPTPKEHWDSNQITPGTPFMQLITEYLVYYVCQRLSTDPGWQNVAVVISDASVPGEGEHKLMEYIRYQRCQEGYNANTRHCIYGLDADLIMLSLATHEPHFSILREDVLVNNNNTNPIRFDKSAPLEEQYKHQPFQERAIDDFVFLCFFVGNDFLPHLPTLEIREGAIDLLVDVYKKALPDLGGYVTHNGILDVTKVQVLLEHIAERENDIMIRRRHREQRDKANRLNRLEQQKHAEAAANNSILPHVPSPASRLLSAESIQIGIDGASRGSDAANTTAAMRLKALLAAATGQVIPQSNLLEPQQVLEPQQPQVAPPRLTPDSMELSATPVDKIQAAMKKRLEPGEAEDELRLGEEGWRDRYYRAKFSVSLDNAEFFQEMTQSYVEGLQWVLRYYYQGCASWAWYFPYHYAPFTKEITQVGNCVIDFSKETRPFKPFEQLLSVLPAESKFLPRSYAQLMVDPLSPIADFYPSEFVVDLNGKRFEWQGVALLPFIDESRLFEAIQGREKLFTKQETRRNTRGSDIILTNKEHPIGKATLALHQTTDDEIPIPPESGIFGSLAASDLLRGNILESPISLLQPQTHNVVAAKFVLPRLEDGHVFEACLLPKVTLPPPVLTKQDIERRQNTRFGPEGSRTVRHSLNQDGSLPPNPHYYGRGRGAGRGGGRGGTEYGRPPNYYYNQGHHQEPPAAPQMPPPSYQQSYGYNLPPHSQLPPHLQPYSPASEGGQSSDSQYYGGQIYGAQNYRGHNLGALNHSNQNYGSSNPRTEANRPEQPFRGNTYNSAQQYPSMDQTSHNAHHHTNYQQQGNYQPNSNYGTNYNPSSGNYRRPIHPYAPRGHSNHPYAPRDDRR